MADSKRQRWGWPLVVPFTSTSPSASAHNLNTTTNGVAWITSTESTDDITKVGFLYGTRTGSGTITYTVGLESVSTSTGLPSGTYLQRAGVDCKTTFTPSTTSSMNNLWQTITLDQSYTPSMGEDIAITIRYLSGVTAGEYSSIVSHDSSPALGFASFSNPYASRLTSGSWSNQSGMPIYALYTSSTCYGRPYQSTYSTATASTVGRRVAMAFTMPSGHGSTFQLRGFNAIAQLASASGKAPKAGIWLASGGGTTQSKIMDGDILRTAGGSARNLIEVKFTSVVTLNYGTAYYAGFEVNDATSAGITLWGTQYGSSNEIAAEPYGADFCLATYDGSNWATDNTVRPYMELLPSDITVPSGGSGALVVHPGMNGGLRG